MVQSLATTAGFSKNRLNVCDAGVWRTSGRMRIEINKLGWAVLGRNKRSEVSSGKARLGTTRATWVGGDGKRMAVVDEMGRRKGGDGEMTNPTSEDPIEGELDVCWSVLLARLPSRCDQETEDEDTDADTKVVMWMKVDDKGLVVCVVCTCRCSLSFVETTQDYGCVCYQAETNVIKLQKTTVVFVIALRQTLQDYKRLQIAEGRCFGNRKCIETTKDYKIPWQSLNCNKKLERRSRDGHHAASADSEF